MLSDERIMCQTCTKSHVMYHCRCWDFSIDELDRFCNLFTFSCASVRWTDCTSSFALPLCWANLAFLDTLVRPRSLLLRCLAVGSDIMG